jgi:glycosyltransferase involved in cell wall biosynthesis
MTNERPLVSVLMTAYNREKYIAEAIESVLSSSSKNFELIIVDDYSKDRTVEIARNYERNDLRIKVYTNEKNLEQFPNRNKAASLAEGKYIKYLDSDDTIYDWSLAYLVEIMEKYPEAGMALISTNPEIKKAYFTSEEAIQTNFFYRSILTIGPSGTILRNDAFKKIGFYNPNYGVPSDMYFNLKMASQFPIVLLGKDFFFYRRHEGQEYNNRYSYLLYNYKYLKDAFDLPGFPLTDKQKKAVLLKAKKSFVLEFFMYIKDTHKIQDAIKAFKNTGMGVSGFLKGIFEYFKKFLT